MGNWVSFGINWILNPLTFTNNISESNSRDKNKSQTNSNYFTSYFIMGGHQFNRSDPETFLFGDLNDLKYLGGNPVLFPYKAPMWFEPIRTLKSLIHIRKETLKFTKLSSEENTSNYNIEFVFDADVKVAITVYYYATEHFSSGKLYYTLDERNLKSDTYYYDPGDGQLFRQPDHVFNPSIICPSSQRDVEVEIEQLIDTFPSPGRSIMRWWTSRRGTGLSRGPPASPSQVEDALAQTPMYPVVVYCVTRDSDVNRQVHVTLASIERSRDRSSGGHVLKPLKQKLVADGLSYLIHEVYGIENKNRKVFPPSPLQPDQLFEPRPQPLHSAESEKDGGDRTVMNLIMNEESTPETETSPSADGMLTSEEEPVGGADVGGQEEAEGEEEEDAFVWCNAECVVCLSSLRDTLILPCRHLCLCHACGNALRYQAGGCPVCRVPFKALLRCKVLRRRRQRPLPPTPNQASPSRQPEGAVAPPLPSSSRDSPPARVGGKRSSEGGIAPLPAGIIPKGFETVPLIEALNGSLPPRVPPVFNLVSSSKLAFNRPSHNKTVDQLLALPAPQLLRELRILSGFPPDFIPEEVSNPGQALMDEKVAYFKRKWELEKFGETSQPASPKQKDAPEMQKSLSERVLNSSSSQINQNPQNLSRSSDHQKLSTAKNSNVTVGFSGQTNLTTPLYSMSYPLTCKSFKNVQNKHSGLRDASKSCKCLYSLLPTNAFDNEVLKVNTEQSSSTLRVAPSVGGLDSSYNIPYIDDTLGSNPGPADSFSSVEGVGLCENLSSSCSSSHSSSSSIHSFSTAPPF